MIAKKTSLLFFFIFFFIHVLRLHATLWIMIDLKLLCAFIIIFVSSLIDLQERIYTRIFIEYLLALAILIRIIGKKKYY